MSYNAKNYTEQGGEKWVIGGTLEIKEGASVTGLPGYTLPAATASALGGVKASAKGVGDTVEAKLGSDKKLYVPTYPSVPVAENQVDSVAATVAELLVDFNALLEKLKTVGLMAADAEAEPEQGQ